MPKIKYVELKPKYEIFIIKNKLLNVINGKFSNSKEHQRPVDGHKASCIFIDLLIIEQRDSITTTTLQNIFIYM